MRGGNATLPRMAVEPDCIFCKIVSGELPATRVAEDDRTARALEG